MGFPYNEQEVIAFQNDVIATYHTHGRETDVNNVVWSARMTYDAVEMGYQLSRAKHLSELEIALTPAGTFMPAPRTYNGNMCGSRVPGVRPVSGGSSDPSLVLSWFIDRYFQGDRQRIYSAWKLKNYTDVLVSWPDSRAIGASLASFIDTCHELVTNGFRPCVFLCSKDFDTHVASELIQQLIPVVDALIHSGAVPRICIGWELSLWLSPVDVQKLIDTLSPQCVAAGIKVYVHFQEGYFAFEVDGPNATTADFWKLQVGKLTGVLHQRKLVWSKQEYQDRIVDCLARFAGGFNFPIDSGFGHPFDFIALEITAQPQFNGTMSESEGDSWGRTALETPAVNGVRVMGSGNGYN